MDQTNSFTLVRAESFYQNTFDPEEETSPSDCEDAFFDAISELPPPLEREEPATVLFDKQEPQFTPFFSLFDFIKIFLPSDPHAKELDEETIPPQSLSQLSLTDAILNPFTPTKDGFTPFETYILDSGAQKAISISQKVISISKKALFFSRIIGIISQKALKNQTIRTYAIYSAASIAGNYITYCTVNEVVETLGPLAFPISAATLASISFTSLPNRIVNQSGISKKILFIAGAYLVANQVSTFASSSYFAIFPQIVAQGVIGTGIQTLVASSTINSNIPIEDTFRTLATTNTIKVLTRAIIPNSELTQIFINYFVFNHKYGIDNIESFFKVTLKSNDLGNLTQLLAISLIENPSILKSIALNQTAFFTRAGIRGFTQYMEIVKNSDRILQAQEHFKIVCLDLDSTDSEKNAAKNHLIRTIKDVININYSMKEKLSLKVTSQFSAFFEKQLKSFNIEKIEKSILSLPVNQERSLYTRTLINIHICGVIAFSVLNASKKSILTLKEQTTFISSITQITIDHYKRIAPASEVLELASAISSPIIQTTTFLIDHLPEALQSPISPPPEERSSSFLSLLTESIRSVFSFFINLFKYITSIGSRN